MNDEKHFRRRMLWTIAMSLGGVVLLWGLYLIRDVLIAVYLSAVLAFGMHPIVSWIERLPLVRHGRRHVPRWIAILVIYVAVLAVITGILAIALPPFIAQARELWMKPPAFADRTQAWLVANHIIKHKLTMTDVIANTPSADVAMTSLFGALQSAIGGFFGVLTIPLLAFFMLADANALHDTVLEFFDEDGREQVSRVIHNVTAKVGAWLAGQLLLAAVITAISAIAFYLLGVPYFYVLALICGVGELVPMIGPMIAMIPAVIVASSAGFDRAVFVTLYLSIQQFLENHFVIPKLMQRRVGVSPVAVLVALLAGASLAGVAGALVGVPTAAIVQILLNEYLEGRNRSRTSTTMPV
jgi:predicted PurR-regulated permease PerM